MTGAVEYNANSLQTFNPATRVGIITNLIEHTNIPDKIAELLSKADANGSVIPAINYPSKKINLAGVIAGSSSADLDDRIDAFKGLFIGKNKNLDIQYGSSTRRYVATENMTSISREQKAFYAKYALEFICTNPFGMDIASTTIANQQNYTISSYTVAPTIGGNAPFQLPVITITLDAISGSDGYVQISNDYTGQDILLYGLALSAGDVIVIDCSKREVRVNGNLVDYSGSFLEIPPGSASITYTDGYVTRQVDIVMTYQKRWL